MLDPIIVKSFQVFRNSDKETEVLSISRQTLVDLIEDRLRTHASSIQEELDRQLIANKTGYSVEEKEKRAKKAKLRRAAKVVETPVIMKTKQHGHVGR